MNEVQAITMISTLLEGLDADARSRVLTWAVDRYVPNGSAKPAAKVALPSGPLEDLNDPEYVPAAEEAPAAAPGLVKAEMPKKRIRQEDLLAWVCQRKQGFTLARLHEQFPYASRSAAMQWMTVLKKLGAITTLPSKRAYYVPVPDKAAALKKKLARGGLNATALAFPESSAKRGQRRPKVKK